MSYPGNASLSPAVQERVRTTFEQALSLYRQGRIDEVIAGCRLIAQMDPSFEPAQRLLDKAQNPSLPIDVDLLLPQADGDRIHQARSAMAARDFQRVIHLTTEILTEDLLNDEARILADQARDKLEASPFVEQFARKCDQLIAAGNLTGAATELEKARALDPSHPEVTRIAGEISRRDAAPASFIVDTPAAPSSRTPAQAAEFGFSFEEEKSTPISFEGFSFDSQTPASSEAPHPAFSFDTPAAEEPSSDFASFSFDASEPAPPPPSPSGGGEFDFATASVETSADDQKKIEQYLADGDRAAEAGNYQQAIDLWSRIFLIDVTNDLASERIEEVKTRRRETERKIEPLLASGIEAFEKGDTERAHADLSEVLRLDPHNTTAQEYLDRLGDTLSPPPAPSQDDPLPLDFFDEGPSPEVQIPIPPAPAAAAPSVKTRPQPESGRKRTPLLLVGALIVVLLAVGGWYAWSRMGATPEAEGPSTQTLITRASTLGENGRFDEAIALLQDVQPNDPLHDQAVMMISDLRQKKAKSAAMIDGVPAAQYFDERLAAARAAFESHDYSTAKIAFEQAMRVRPLPDEDRAAYDAASEQVGKLGAATALFKDGKYTEALVSLQGLLEQDRRNQSVQRMIVDAHFNLGATSLQEERTGEAAKHFEQVLAISPEDDLARRSRDLALRYHDQPKDLLYRIYVRYLPLRKAQ